MKRISLAAAVAFGASVVACVSCVSHGRLKLDKPLSHVSADVRRDAIRRAQVWEPTDIASKDLRVGPKGHGSFEPDETVKCTFVKKQMTGNSPKFECVIPPDDPVKVKFGRENGEVYAEVAATRLFWALGFPVDRMYPVRVLCTGCPPGKETTREDGSAAIVFDPASIERKLKGEPIETAVDSGWAWPELDLVDETAGGAPRAQRDALKLLAVFVQHTDNKPAQQRLICVDEKETEKGTEKGKEKGNGKEKEKEKTRVTEDARCAHPVMMVNDLGQTFGRSNLFNRDAVGSVNLEKWSSARIWSDPKLCIGDLPPSQTGTLDHPQISEAGRKFLADLLMQLSDAQLRALFDVARFAERTEGTRHTPTVDDWIDAFKKKRGEIASATCPS